MKHSGVFVLRVSPDDHKALKEQAHREGISLNQLCARKLSAPISNQNPGSNDDPFINACMQYWANSRYQIVGLVLFGSAARGEMRASSDIDLLLVLDSDVKPTRELYREWSKWEKTPEFKRFKPNHEVTPQFVSLPIDPMGAGGLWYETAIDGVILWERSGQISRILRNIRERIADGSITRATTHGHPYWIKKKAG